MLSVAPDREPLDLTPSRTEIDRSEHLHHVQAKCEEQQKLCMRNGLHRVCLRRGDDRSTKLAMYSRMQEERVGIYPSVLKQNDCSSQLFLNTYKPTIELYKGSLNVQVALYSHGG